MHLLELGIAVLGIFLITRRSFGASTGFDLFLQQYIDRLPHGYHKFFATVSAWFRPRNVIIGLLTLLVWAILSAQWRAVVLLLLIVGGLKLTEMSRTIFCRHRPLGDKQQLKPKLQDNFSFPSNYAASSLMLAFIIVYLLNPPLMLGRLVVGVAIGIGLSRVFMRAHHPTDIIGGWLFALGLWGVVRLLVSS